MRKNLLLLIGGIVLSTSAFAQDEEIDLFALSLEELMNVEIISASKKEESTFDAPVSSSVITRDEIDRSGATSIPEALRLSPGLIVRETSNGNYDVFVRGFDNLHRYGSSTEHHNLYTLVMIDNRPVFNYNLGGTYWESLPIDLVDIERIEIVRGPNAPLFGPNAVTGVINIITRRTEKRNLYASGNLQYGSSNTKIGNAAVGMKVNDQWSFMVSGNYQERKRSDDQYYVYNTDEFVESPPVGSTTNPKEAYPDTERSLLRHGLNALVTYQANHNVQLGLSAGLQEAEAQRFNYASGTPLTFNFNQSQYLSLDGRFYGARARISYNQGYDNLIPGSAFAAEYDFATIDAVIDYQWDITNKLSLRPALSYQSAQYDDTPYLSQSAFSGFFNGDPSVNNIAVSLRSDYLLTDHWRLIGAARVDKFSYPDDTYLSYQLATTYKIKKKYLFRAAHARSNSGAFLNNSINISSKNEIAPGSGLFTTTNTNGNPDLKLATVTMTEVGFRGQLTDNLQFDVELFHQDIKNLFSIALTSYTFQSTGLPAPNDVAPEVIQQNYVNLPLTAVQNGATLSVNFVSKAGFQIRPFVTVQQTNVRDLSRIYNTLPISETNPKNLYSTTDVKHESTPGIFGGAYINAAFTKRLNANVNAYFFGDHILYANVDQVPARETEVNNISSKILVNTKLSYRLVDKLRIYGTMKNLLGNNSREHYGTDRIGRSYWVGASYNF